MTDWVQVVDSLPTELQRDLLEIRGLDLRTEMLVQSLNDRINKVVTHAADLEDHGPSSVRQINEDFTKALAMADEKVQLAVKAYEAIDQHKKRLDAEISRYETTLATKVDNDGASSNGGGGSSSSKKSSHKKKGHAPVGKISANTKADKKSKKQRAEEDEDQPTDADGNEPTYCLCSRVSFGLMTACDNPGCPVEWFHNICVGLKDPPKGKWYCPICSKK